MERVKNIPYFLTKEYEAKVRQRKKALVATTKILAVIGTAGAFLKLLFIHSK
jgi:hypothetical protein